MPKVLVFGSLNIDYVYKLDHIVKDGETISCSSMVKSAGGKGANQAAAIAKAGLDVYMAGKIGPDGMFLLDELKSYGVDTSFVSSDSSATGNAIIQVDKNGDNCIIVYPGGNNEITVEFIDSTLSQFSSGDIIVLQNEINSIGRIIEIAHKKGLLICFNPSPFDMSIEKLPLNLVDFLVVNEIEGRCLALMDENACYDAILDKLSSDFPDTEIILTVGKDGALYAKGGYKAKADIIETPIVDTTAAGDTFIGYFLSSRQKGYSIEQSLVFSCKASSIAVSRPGAMKSIPFENEVFPFDS